MSGGGPAAVIIGVGEVCDRWASLEAAREPLTLMADAARIADGRGLLRDVDSIDVVNLISWRYAVPAAQLAESLGASPRRLAYGEIGGESPVRMIDEAARRIREGESEIALICGAEALYSVKKAREAGERLAWTALAKRTSGRESPEGYVNSVALAQGASRPVDVYPLFENAALAAWSQASKEGVEESAQIWKKLSDVAATRECAWTRRAHTLAEIRDVAPDNRIIVSPYRKRMIANPEVNQGTAILLASEASARRFGVPESDWIYVWPGVFADEPRNYLARPDFQTCPAQNFVLDGLTRQLTGASPQCMEIYSCFPIVPKLARRRLGLSIDTPLSVAGGLSFFGGPLNNYMSHAAVAMTQKLRDGAVQNGMLYGQGEYLTKHHGVILSTYRHDPPAAERLPTALVQSAPDFVEAYEGLAIVETMSVKYSRDGQPACGVVVARIPTGQRLMARARDDDEDALHALSEVPASPIGRSGRVWPGGDGRLLWRFQ